MNPQHWTYAFLYLGLTALCAVILAQMAEQVNQANSPAGRVLASGLDPSSVYALGGGGR